MSRPQRAEHGVKGLPHQCTARRPGGNAPVIQIPKAGGQHHQRCQGAHHHGVRKHLKNAPYMPCCTGSFTLEAACTITEGQARPRWKKAPPREAPVTAGTGP